MAEYDGKYWFVKKLSLSDRVFGVSNLAFTLWHHSKQNLKYVWWSLH
jgi:hypothetical protein